MAATAFSRDVFNALQHISESAKWSLSEGVKALGDVISHHKMQHLTGAIRLHHHFPLEENERIVAEVQSDTFISVKPIAVSATEEAGLIPYQWKYSVEEGAWFPLQFFRASKETAAIRDRAFAIFSNVPFLTDVANVLCNVEGGKADQIGLYALYEDVLKGSSEGLMEWTYTDLKKQSIFPYKAEEGGEPWSEERGTSWRFSENGDGVIRVFCSCYCNDHPHSHRSWDDSLQRKSALAGSKPAT